MTPSTAEKASGRFCLPAADDLVVRSSVARGPGGERAHSLVAEGAEVFGKRPANRPGELQTDGPGSGSLPFRQQPHQFDP
jgi:hypothetical protein